MLSTKSFTVPLPVLLVDESNFRSTKRNTIPTSVSSHKKDCQRKFEPVSDKKGRCTKLRSSREEGR